MAQDIVLRPVRDSDSQALIELIGSCYSEYVNCILDVETEEQWLKALASYYEKVSRIGSVLWVVEIDSRLCACIGVKFDESGRGEPKTLYVAKYARKKGLATFLMALVENYARFQGVKSWSFWSDTRFEDAHRLYKKLGYMKTGRTRMLRDISDSAEFEFAKVLSV